MSLAHLCLNSAVMVVLIYHLHAVLCEFEAVKKVRKTVKIQTNRAGSELNCLETCDPSICDCDKETCETKVMTNMSCI